MNIVLEHITKLIKSMTLDKLTLLKEEFEKVLSMINEEVDKKLIELGEVEDLDDTILEDELSDLETDDYEYGSFVVDDFYEEHFKM